MVTSLTLHLVRKAAYFILIVAIFAMLGPATGAFAASIVFWVVDAWKHGPNLNVLYANFVLMLIFAYPVGIKSAVLAGAVVASAGIFLRWNGPPIAIVAGLAAVLLHWFLEYPAVLPMSSFFGVFLFLFPLLCVIASMGCWYVTRGLVRSSWQSV